MNTDPKAVVLEYSSLTASIILLDLGIYWSCCINAVVTTSMYATIFEIFECSSRTASLQWSHCINTVIPLH